MLPATFEERVELLLHEAEAHPERVRAWVEKHPRNLMVFCGIEPTPAEDAAFAAALGGAESLPTLDQPRVAIIMAAWLALSDPDNWDAAIPDVDRQAVLSAARRLGRPRH
jgi:hypothetical protein